MLRLDRIEEIARERIRQAREWVKREDNRRRAKQYAVRAGCAAGLVASGFTLGLMASARLSAPRNQTVVR